MKPGNDEGSAVRTQIPQEQDTVAAAIVAGLAQEINAEHAAAHADARSALERVALLASDTPTLPGFDADTKVGDGRHRWYVERYGQRCWELDAMPPPLLRERVRKSIWRFIDEAQWDHAAVVERAEVESMQQFHAAWTKRISGQATK